MALDPVLVLACEGNLSRDNEDGPNCNTMHHSNDNVHFLRDLVLLRLLRSERT